MEFSMYQSKGNPFLGPMVQSGDFLEIIEFWFIKYTSYHFSL